MKLSIIQMILILVSIGLYILSLKSSKVVGIVCIVFAGIFQAAIIAFGMYEGTDLLTLVMFTIIICIIDYVLLHFNEEKMQSNKFHSRIDIKNNNSSNEMRNGGEKGDSNAV